jgi:hypothetical protein
VTFGIEALSHLRQLVTSGIEALSHLRQLVTSGIEALSHLRQLVTSGSHRTITKDNLPKIKTIPYSMLFQNSLKLIMPFQANTRQSSSSILA